MVLLTTTPLIRSLLASLHSSSTDNNSTPTPTLPPSTSPSIDHALLIALSRLPSTPPLHTLLRHTSVYTPPLPAPPRPSEEYLESKRRLLEERERREYAALLSSHSDGTPTSTSLFSNISGRNKSTDDPTDDPEGSHPDTVTPALVLNIFLSTLLCGAGTFVLFSRHGVFGNGGRGDGWRVLVSMAVGIVVAVAEVGLFVIYGGRVEGARRKERSIKERKRMVGEKNGGGSGQAVGPRTGMEERVDVETEEIWSKGVNGGMRRRVREKWERERERDDKERREKERLSEETKDR